MTAAAWAPRAAARGAHRYSSPEPAATTRTAETRAAQRRLVEGRLVDRAPLSRAAA